MLTAAYHVLTTGSEYKDLVHVREVGPSILAQRSARWPDGSSSLIVDGIWRTVH